MNLPGWGAVQNYFARFLKCLRLSMIVETFLIVMIIEVVHYELI